MNNLKIRNATIKDARVLLNIYKPYVENTAITFEWDVPSVEEFEKRISEHIENGYSYLVAELNNEIVGYAYASRFRERKAYDLTVELSVYISEKAHRIGVGKALYKELEQELKMKKFKALVACITNAVSENNSSIKFHEKMGFKNVGQIHHCGFKAGNWYDIIFMEKFI